jgi:hypothetical protein
MGAVEVNGVGLGVREMPFVSKGLIEERHESPCWRSEDDSSALASSVFASRG